MEEINELVKGLFVVEVEQNLLGFFDVSDVPFPVFQIAFVILEPWVLGLQVFDG